MIEKLLGLPVDASAHGARIDGLLLWVHVLMAVLFVGWIGFFLYTIFRFRRSAHPKADYVGVTTHTSSYIEAGVAIIEVILLVALSIPFWAWKVNAARADDPNVVRIRVIAQQFAWNVHYPGPDGVFGRTDVSLVDTQSNPLGLDRKDPAAKDDVTTINQLHLPAGRPALVSLSSKDVIHSFALQEMRVKQDVIPGVSTDVWFVPKVTTDEMRARTGNPEFGYEISCAQLCGLGHYRMRGFVTIHSPEAFQAWLDEQEAQLAESSEDAIWN